MVEVQLVCKSLGCSMYSDIQTLSIRSKSIHTFNSSIWSIHFVKLASVEILCSLNPMTLLIEGSNKFWSWSIECRFVSWSWSSLNSCHFWESQVCFGELDDFVSSKFTVFEFNCLDNVDALMSCTVSSGHFLVHLGDSAVEGGISVLSVHVYIILSC